MCSFSVLLDCSGFRPSPLGRAKESRTFGPPTESRLLTCHSSQPNSRFSTFDTRCYPSFIPRFSVSHPTLPGDRPAPYSSDTPASTPPATAHRAAHRPERSPAQDRLPHPDPPKSLDHKVTPIPSLSKTPLPRSPCPRPRHRATPAAHPSPSRIADTAAGLSSDSSTIT